MVEMSLRRFIGQVEEKRDLLAQEVRAQMDLGPDKADMMRLRTLRAKIRKLNSVINAASRERIKPLPRVKQKRRPWSSNGQ
jgi:hypothetical protein